MKESNSTAPANSMRPGWSYGGAKTHAAVRIYHYFKGADNISLCKRATRNSTHETSEDAPEAYKCAKCGERHHNRPAPKPAERRVANG